jgi:hypothetical protein
MKTTKAEQTNWSLTSCGKARAYLDGRTKKKPATFEIAGSDPEIMRVSTNRSEVGP